MTNQRGPGFRYDIEGLRAVAVGAVALTHFGIAAMPGGFIGVDMFFVISGFLIVGLMAKEADLTGRISMKGFYARRARRILPAAMVVLLLVCAFASSFLNPIAAQGVLDDAKWAVFFATNFLLINRGSDYFGQSDAASPIQHYWSLAVEEQFYLVAPILLVVIVLATRRRAPAARWWTLAVVLGVIAAASLAWSVYLTPREPASAYFSTSTRAWQLALGGLTALLVSRLAKPGARPVLATALAIPGLIGIVGCVLLLDGDGYPGWIVVFPTVATALILAGGAFGTGPAQWLLAVSPLRAIGRISFSVYLWHWPLVLFVDGRWPNLGGATRVLTLVVATLTLSAITYAFVEYPFMRLRDRDWEPLRHRLLTALALVVAGYTAVGMATFPWSSDATANDIYATDLSSGNQNATPVDAWTNKVIQGAELSTLPVASLNPPLQEVGADREPDACLNVTDQNIDDCSWGATGPDARTVVVLGDSHALMWLTALRTVFDPDVYRVQSLGFGGCTNSDITRREDDFPTLGATCDAHRRWVWDKVAQIKPDVVVMSDFAGFVNWTDDQGRPRTDGTQQAWADGLRTSLAKLKPNAGELVIIGQTPRGKNLEECLPANLDLAPCFGDDSYMSQQRAIERDLVTEAGGTFVDDGPWFCYGSRCPPVIDNTAVFFDDNHITVSMEKKLVPLLRYDLRPVLEKKRSS